jgi:zinc transporter ZupT
VAQISLLAKIIAFNFNQTILYAHKRGWIGNSRMEQLLAHQEDSGLLTSTRRHHSHENNNDESGFAQIDGEEEDAHFDPKTHSTFRVLLLVFALSLHAMFEGLSIGMVSDVPILLQVNRTKLKKS